MTPKLLICIPGDERDVGRVEEFVARVLNPEMCVNRITGANVPGDHEAALACERVKVPQCL